MRDCSKPRARCCLGAHRLAPMAAGGPEPCLLCSQEFLGRAGDGALPVEPAPLLPLAHRLPSRAGFLEGDRSSDSSFPNGLQVKNSAQKYRHTHVCTHMHTPSHFICTHMYPPSPVLTSRPLPPLNSSLAQTRVWGCVSAPSLSAGS